MRRWLDQGGRQAMAEFTPEYNKLQPQKLYSYLPGNGGLLAAVAMMACGWDGSAHAPGFPQDGSWTIRWEGLHQLM